MDFEKFYLIANYLNEINRNIWSAKEIACAAYDYILEYELSKAKGKPTSTMYSLCEELVADMDSHDYDGLENNLDMDTMETIFNTVLEEM